MKAILKTPLEEYPGYASDPTCVCYIRACARIHHLELTLRKKNRKIRGLKLRLKESKQIICSNAPKIRNEEFSKMILAKPFTSKELFLMFDREQVKQVLTQIELFQNVEK